MPDSIKLISVALDCPHAGKLAAFYADITGGKVTFADDRWATVKGPGGQIDFQTASGYARPTWPDTASSMQMHLDFYVDDADAAEARVLAAGATKYNFQPGDHVRVYADPAGHPFCLCTVDAPAQA
jgi:Glyoxalase-like domain